MHPSLEQICTVLEEIAPKALCADFDNSGLQCGDLAQGISRILLCVDCTQGVAEQAKAYGCELILSHHPLIFPSIKNLCEQEGVGRILRMLIRNNTALVAAHTNMDFVRGGLCDILADIFKLTDPQVIEPVGDKGDGYGRIGAVEPVTVYELAQFAKQALCATTVRYTGGGNRSVERLAVLSGRGASALDAALEKGAQCAITGDVKYSEGLTYCRQGLSLIDAGHYDTEKVILQPWRNYLQNKLNALQYKVDLMITSMGADVFTQV